MLERLRTSDGEPPWWLVPVAIAAVAAIPLVLSGPGNDLDVGNVFRSGRAIAMHLDYVPSRPPGAPVHEAIVGVLDVIGGPLLTNLASLAAATGVLWALFDLLEREGLAPGARWGVALVAANPWFVIAASSTADYVFALLFVLLAARAIRRDQAVAAGLLAAAAMGCRVGSVTLLIALAVAELGASRERRRTVGVSTAIAAGATIVLFIPSMLAAGGLSFAQNDFSTSSPLVQLGRAAAKDLLLLGIPATIVGLLALPAIVAALRTWSTSWLVRFSVIGLVLSQVLFIRFPWKMAHLLPTLLCLAILYAVALAERPRILIAMVVLQLVFALVRVDVVQPDDPDQATGGRIDPGLTWGPVARDLDCRRQDPDAYRGRQKVEIEAAWVCTQPFER